MDLIVNVILKTPCFRTLGFVVLFKIYVGRIVSVCWPFTSRTCACVLYTLILTITLDFR